MTDLADFDWVEAVRRAQEDGDESQLLERLRNPSINLSMEERLFIAGTRDGTIKLKRGPKEKVRSRALETYWTWRERCILGDQRDHAYDFTARELGKSRRTVIEHVKLWEEDQTLKGHLMRSLIDASVRALNSKN